MPWGSRRQQGRAGPETKSMFCQESRSQDKAGAKAGLRVGQELSQRVGGQGPRSKYSRIRVTGANVLLSAKQ